MNEYLQARISRLREQARELEEKTAELIAALTNGGQDDREKR